MTGDGVVVLIAWSLIAWGLLMGIGGTVGNQRNGDKRVFGGFGIPVGNPHAESGKSRRWWDGDWMSYGYSCGTKPALA